MKKPEMPHAMHDEHLCYLVNMGYIETSIDDYKALVKDAKFVCEKCGRAANSNENLCRPIKI
jgi:DNA replicative helicase MCM subunit Mcm2 (Cdc46/Mcm family)